MTLLLTAVTAHASGEELPPLSLEGHIPMPEVEGRIDHLSVDLTGHRLFVAAVENGTVEVIDVKAGRRVHTIRDLSEPQGVFFDAGSGHLYVACGDGSTRIFDGATFRPLASVKFPEDADNIRRNPRHPGIVVGFAGAKQIRKGSEGTGGLGFVDLDGKLTGTVVIDAHPESFQFEEAGNRIFVNVPDKREIEVVDAGSLAVLQRWPVASAEGNFPMALDEAHHRLFIGTWTLSRLLVLDTQSGLEIASHYIAGRSDDIFYDSRRARVYVLATAGFIEVFRQNDPDHYERIAHVPTPARTQTGLFVPEWGKLFAATRKLDDRIAELQVYAVN